MHSLTVYCLVINCVTSCSFLGDFSGHGLYLMASSLQKIWSDAWRITTQRLGSGEAGIEVITFGLSGVLLYYVLAWNCFIHPFFFVQLYLYSIGGFEKRYTQHRSGVFICRLMAWPNFSIVGLGLARQFVCHSWIGSVIPSLCFQGSFQFTPLSLNSLTNLHCFSTGNIYGIDTFVLLAVYWTLSWWWLPILLDLLSGLTVLNSLLHNCLEPGMVFDLWL